MLLCTLAESNAVAEDLRVGPEISDYVPPLRNDAMRFIGGNLNCDAELGAIAEMQAGLQAQVREELFESDGKLLRMEGRALGDSESLVKCSSDTNQIHESSPTVVTNFNNVQLLKVKSKLG